MHHSDSSGDEIRDALSDRDQTSADADQGGADLDQTAADVDQHAADRDQVAADRDQDAADDDQAAADAPGPADADGDSRRARAQSSRDRDRGAQERAMTSSVRDEAATRRDQTAAHRDEAARARDRLAAALDAEVEERTSDYLGASGPTTRDRALARAGELRRRSADVRARAAAQRDAAARDRELAAEDRRLAAVDRAAAAHELEQEGIDHLTGTHRRRVGLAAMQRELERTDRAGTEVVVAFVDVNELKAVNDRDGHVAGDELLENVAAALLAHLRAYDVVLRYGGDEFVCLLTDQSIDGVRDRFRELAAELADRAAGATFTVGFAERRADDTLDALISRADDDMRDRKPHRTRG